ncbi:type II toxin-antitoxin system RelE/ParE family toxin [Oricola sp.]|uniref:type II toxin-antitoxin system RelE/ParE family toxin n=1 Tax=Oricola sp. TaxID=1979950 RepID=UPI0026002E91|nr:type II toxin-antitoxin system RelE/ParE family toxin [Oricola sp.]MCI5078473.1 type II toxin-antitoxin system RelE/ParE family toxin [Oricola sp.]
MRLGYSPAARHDLIVIGDYIHADNPAAAIRFVDELEARCAKLVDFPELGVERSDIAPGLRAIRFRAYLIFYRLEDGPIRIERVLHGARDIAAIMGEG